MISHAARLKAGGVNRHRVRSSPDPRLIRAKNSSSLWAASAMTCSSVLLRRALSRSL
jgi:hypothetical protein